jgi:purine-binding chemotaxis protein CheW
MRNDGNDIMCDLVVFKIGEREFCIDGEDMLENRAWTPATPLPHSPRHVHSLTTVGGMTMPLMDMSDCLGLGRADPIKRHAVIVALNEGRRAALLVDSVSGRVSVRADRIQQVAGAGDNIKSSAISGIAIIEDRMVCVVELDAMFGAYGSEAA